MIVSNCVSLFSRMLLRTDDEPRRMDRTGTRKPALDMNQLLNDQPGKRGGKLIANDFLALSGNAIVDPVNGVFRVRGVQGSENQMPGLGRRESGPYGIRVLSSPTKMMSGFSRRESSSPWLNDGT